jgi:hypothetical protein
VGSWEVSGAQLVAGWGLEVVERGKKGGVQILQRFASGFPRSSKQKGQGGWGDAATVQREEKEVAG